MPPFALRRPSISSLSNPIEQQQRPIARAFFGGLAVAATIWIGLLLLTPATPIGKIVSVIAALFVVFGNIVALDMLRRNLFRLAALTSALSLVWGLGVVLSCWGLRTGTMMLTPFALSVAIAGLLADRRGLLLTAGWTILIVVVIGALDVLAPTLVGFAPLQGNTTLITVGTCVLVTIVLGILVDQFGASLRAALATSLQREQELERIRAAQETTIADRTASLQTALQSVQEREAELTTLVAELQASRDVIRELSAPVIPVLDRILVAPIVGDLDSARAHTLTANVLQQIEQRAARYIILDITGVPTVDTHVAQVLINTAAAAKLLGAHTLLAGIRPEVAHTITTLGIDLSAIVTFSSLQEAIETLIIQRDQRRLSTPAIRPQLATS